MGLAQGDVANKLWNSPEAVLLSSTNLKVMCDQGTDGHSRWTLRVRKEETSGCSQHQEYLSTNPRLCWQCSHRGERREKQIPELQKRTHQTTQVWAKKGQALGQADAQREGAQALMQEISVWSLASWPDSVFFLPDPNLTAKYGTEHKTKQIKTKHGLGNAQRLGACAWHTKGPSLIPRTTADTPSNQNNQNPKSDYK